MKFSDFIFRTIFLLLLIIAFVWNFVPDTNASEYDDLLKVKEETPYLSCMKYAKFTKWKLEKLNYKPEIIVKNKHAYLCIRWCIDNGDYSNVPFRRVW